MIQQTQGTHKEKELELTPYARIGSWMFARTTNRHFMTLLELNSTRNKQHPIGGSSTSNIDLEKRLLKMMALIIDFMDNA